MSTSEYSLEQIAQMLQQSESGTSIMEICCKVQVTDRKVFRWRTEFGNVGTLENRESRQLGEENKKLKQLVADFCLHRMFMRDFLRRSGQHSAAADMGALEIAGGARSPSALPVRLPTWRF